VVGEPGVGVETDVGPDLLRAPDDAGDDVVQDAAAVGAEEETSLKATQEDVIDDRWVVEAGVFGPAKESRGARRIDGDWSRHEENRCKTDARGLAPETLPRDPRSQRGVSNARNETLTVETLR
jgi:hypothetical protein